MAKKAENKSLFLYTALILLRSSKRLTSCSSSFVG